jgi:hypothetical protein
MLILRHVHMEIGVLGWVYLDVGVDGVEGQLEADLVVALASAAV